METSETLRVRRVYRPSSNSSQRQVYSDDRAPLDESPRSVYELLTRKMLEEMKSELAEVKGRVNTLLWLVAGAILVDIAMRLAR